VIQLTKVDAARHQLVTAIRMFFAEADPVSIHTLASAAQEILRGLTKARGIPSPSVKDTDLIPEDKRGIWLKAVNREQNFFKHADRDPDESLVFDPDFVPYVIHDAAAIYSKLTGGTIPRECAAFAMWFILKHPQVLKPEALQRIDITRFPRAQEYAHSNRKMFLAWLEIDDLWHGLD
jgi:hypothetical protein